MDLKTISIFLLLVGATCTAIAAWKATSSTIFWEDHLIKLHTKGEAMSLEELNALAGEAFARTEKERFDKWWFYAGIASSILGILL